MKEGIITALGGLVLLGVLVYLWVDQPVGEPLGSTDARANARSRVERTKALGRIWLLADRSFEAKGQCTARSP